MVAYDINIMQPAEDSLFGKRDEQNICIGTYFAKKAQVVKHAKLLQRLMGKQVIVTVIKRKIIAC